MESETPSLDEFRPPEIAQAELCEFFPSRSSFNWELRNHREAHARGGSIVKVAGRIWVHPARFKAVVLAEGRAALIGGAQRPAELPA